jgi:hypothetical protein
MCATATSTFFSATRARARSGTRPSSVSSADSGAPATAAVRRKAPRGAASTVDSALASTVIASARQVRAVATARSSTVSAPAVSESRSTLTAGGALRDGGRRSRSAMFNSPRSERTIRSRRPSMVASRTSRWPRSSAPGAKRTSSRSISASEGPGSRSARRRPRTSSRPRASARSKRSTVTRRSVAASIWRTMSHRAMPGNCHQRIAAESTRARTTIATIDHRRRFIYPACLVPHARARGWPR